MRLNQKWLGCIILASMVNIGEIHAENVCEFTPTWDPNMNKKIMVSISKNRDKTKDTVIEILSGNPEITGRIRIGGRYNWECNYANIKDASWDRIYVTAKHCVSDNFWDVFNDVWSGTSFRSIDFPTRMLKWPFTSLEIWEVPQYDDTVEIQWCVQNGYNCVKISGKWSPVYKDKDKIVEWIWLSREDYKKYFEEKTNGLTWLSGSPVMNKDGKVFWVVSATAQSGFEYDEKWECKWKYYAIWVGKITKEN